MSTNQDSTPERLRFCIEREDGTAPGMVVFRLSGPFTARRMYESLAPVALRNILESALHPQRAPLHVFDLSRVPYVDSAGLAVLAGQFAKCRAVGIRVIAVGASDRLIGQICSARMNGRIPVATSLPGACA